MKLNQSFSSRTNTAVTNSTSDLFNLPSLISAGDTTSPLTKSVINYFYSQRQRFYETLTTVTRNIQLLKDDSIRLSAESLRQQHLSQKSQNDINLIKQSKAEIDSYIAGFKFNQDILLQESASVKQKGENLRQTSYDGTLIWKISNVAEKMADAELERQTSIYSPTFYSSPTGYKMRIRLYLQGDENARRTHMSLSFLIMRGRFDTILRWPFDFTVGFCLYDQSGQQRHIINSFRPDTKSDSFQRPKNEMNIDSGISKFFPLPMTLHDHNSYIKDDTMYIKCLIDFGDISKIILPYALSLNPALPHHIQHLIIQPQQQSISPTNPANYNNNDQNYNRFANDTNTTHNTNSIQSYAITTDNNDNNMLRTSREAMNGEKYQQNEDPNLEHILGIPYAPLISLHPDDTLTLTTILNSPSNENSDNDEEM
ncbi:unnamed protein product [Didymodactylos carnosus]|uniref:MATH domain-containing protein n=2 Tax=Didymodactylos carnosus TaxID=1234261 RepID=A0A8S2F3V6_9BILA|nr:unnamed protein product [Didymodactylos carnosus]CAF4195981.1 unnamed protein product [Didymodactylos carnosus]